MDPNVRMALGLAMRWLHISSVITLLGGFIFARFVVAPSVAALPEQSKPSFDNALAARFRGILYTVLATILISGIYNYLTKAIFPPGYHMWIGIKFLLVLHIFAVSVLYTLPSADQAKRARWSTGIVLSGLIVVLISAYLRWLTLNA